MAVPLVVGWPGAGRIEGVQVVLLDTEPAAAFVRTPGGQTALVRTSTAARGIAAGVGAYLAVSETGVDVEIGPGGVRPAVDLVDLETERAGHVDDERSNIDSAEHGDTDDRRDGEMIGPDRGAPTDARPGMQIGLGDGVVVEVVDVRVAGQRQVADLAVLVDGVAILLPGPGSPSTRWGDVAPDAASIAAVPSGAVSWARALPPRRWLLLVGEPTPARARNAQGVPFLARREYGSVELSMARGTLAVETERCPEGRACVVELPPPAFGALLSQLFTGDVSNDRRPPVQSGRTGDGS
jgi:hypothetical protein